MFQVLLDCSWYQVGCQISEGISAIIEGFFQWLAEAIIDALRSVVTMAISFWAFVDTPDLDSGGYTYGVGGAASGAPSDVATLLSYFKYGGLVVAVVALSGFAIHLVIRLKSGSGVEGFTKLTFVLGGTALVGAASSIGARIYSSIVDGGFAFAAGNGPVGFVQGHLAWYSAVVLIISIICGAIKLIVDQDTKHLIDIVKGIGVYALVATSSVMLANLFIGMTDSFSEWILRESMGGGESTFDPAKFASGIIPEFKFEDSLPDMVISVIGYMVLIIVVGTIGIIASLIQLFLMMFRNGIAHVMIGALVIVAAMWNLAGGRRAFESVLKWTLAWFLYKPVASIIYATAVVLLGSDGFMLTMSGITLIIVAVVALPMLLKLFDTLTPAIIGAALGGIAAMLASPTGGVLMATGAKLLGAATGALAGGGPAGAATVSGGGSFSGGGASGAGGSGTGSGGASGTSGSSTGGSSTGTGGSGAGGGASGGGGSPGGTSGGGAGTGTDSSGALDGGGPSGADPSVGDATGTGPSGAGGSGGVYGSETTGADPSGAAPAGGPAGSSGGSAGGGSTGSSGGYGSSGVSDSGGVYGGDLSDSGLLPGFVGGDTAGVVGSDIAGPDSSMLPWGADTSGRHTFGGDPSQATSSPALRTRQVR